jgi:[acyl-carrier-protein] S-malonyltransferase
LGEIAAWSAVGAVEPEQAIDLAAARARLMAREAARFPGGMLALVDQSESTVEDALRLGCDHGAISLAARNAPGDWVLSGEKPALGAVAARYRSVPVATEGAWHSRAMEGAVEELEHVLTVPQKACRSCGLVDGATGKIAEQQEEIPHLFARHLVEPIDWIAVMSTLRSRGVRRFVTVGPGKVMRALVRKNLGAEVDVLSTETPRDLEQTIGDLQR